MSGAATKTCSKCGEVKAVDLFPVSKAKTACKACASAWTRQNYAKHKQANSRLGDKSCSYCGKKKPLADFVPTTNCCKQCRSIYNKKWAEKNAECLHAYAKKRYAADRLQQLANAKQWAANNRERSNANKRRWAEKNPGYSELCRLRRKEENPELYREKINSASRRQRANLLDCSLKSNISRDTGIPNRLIPRELIEVKRKHLQILRALKEKPNER